MTGAWRGRESASRLRLCGAGADEDGTFNRLAIAVEPTLQGSGIGKAIVAEMMQRLRSQNGRVMLVETSSLEDYAATQAFYDGQGFSREARIRDFYAAGEDKLIFWKSL